MIAAAAVAGIGRADVLLAAELTVEAVVLAVAVFLLWDARRSFAYLAVCLAADARAAFRAPAGRHRAHRLAPPATAPTSAPTFAEAPTLVLPPLEIQ